MSYYLHKSCNTIYRNHVNNSSENIVYEHIAFEWQRTVMRTLTPGISEETMSYDTQCILYRKEDGTVIGIYKIQGENGSKVVEGEVDCVIGANLKFTNNCN